MQSDTPRTDAEEVVCCEDEMCVPSSFSRQLERELAAAWMVKDDLLAELAKVRQQRDEARREICYDEMTRRYETGHPVATERGIAAERGWWDCFKEKDGGGA